MRRRFFRYDVFLSHNAEDGSHLLRDRLAAMGVTAWHDGYADMTDRQVQLTIWSALGESRYICVCVHDGFRDSEWVRIEYGTGLKIERDFGLPRVIVARTGRNGKIPEGLERSRHFDTVSEGIEPLVRFLIGENARLPKGTLEDSLDEAEKRRLETLRKLRSVTASQSHFEPSAVERGRLLRERLIYLLDRPPGQDLSWTIRELLWDLRGEGRLYAATGFTAVWRSEEMRLLYLDMFERLAARPELIRSCSEFITDTLFADAIADIVEDRKAAERAYRVFGAVHEILSGLIKEERTRDRLRGGYWAEALQASRAFIDDLRGGYERREARQRRNQRLSRKRPFWKFW
jgi:hypothetical protein